MKYVYNGNFDLKKCLERLKKHLAWRKDPAFQLLTPEAEDYLVLNPFQHNISKKKGYIYSFGRDY